jgi:hypothetical protein
MAIRPMGFASLNHATQLSNNQTSGPLSALVMIDDILSGLLGGYLGDKLLKLVPPERPSRFERITEDARRGRPHLMSAVPPEAAEKRMSGNAPIPNYSTPEFSRDGPKRCLRCHNLRCSDGFSTAFRPRGSFVPTIGVDQRRPRLARFTARSCTVTQRVSPSHSSAQTRPGRHCATVPT